MFWSRNQLTNIPQDNAIGAVVETAWTEYLVHLLTINQRNLKNNKIREIQSNAFRYLTGVEIIHLDDNSLQTIKSETFVDMPKLNILSIESNGLICDCRIHSFHLWLLQQTQTNAHGAVCSNLNGQMIKDVPNVEECKETTTESKNLPITTENLKTTKLVALTTMNNIVDQNVRLRYTNANTRLSRRLDEAKENSNFDEEEVIATLGKLVQKQTLFEDLNEQILKLTEPENVENEIIDSDEYSVDMETKIRHIRKFIQNVQTPQSRHIDSHTTTHTLNPETIPFVPTHNIANPHNAQSFENPSVQASHTFNTQQKYNPADLLTRGIDADQYINSVIWKKGPNWLTNRTKWPELTPIIEENDDEETVNNEVHTDYYGINNIIDIRNTGLSGN
ncbi:unnamed protein product [Mytilus edulis]|uniref:Uncharacterized protein n=1 Tax=Mytilus edulis TaxID=6550 RepID=A0A8S3PVA2_MYTED|nr:unnamed protein product [Mytilus edulis]